MDFGELPRAPQWRAAEELAATISSKLAGAKVVPKPSDHSIEIRWLEGDLPLRMTLDVEWDDIEVAAHAGNSHELLLIRDPRVELEDAGDPWELVERKVFFAENIYVEGSIDETAAQAALLATLPTELFDELLAIMERLSMDGVELGGDVAGGDVGKLTRTTDGGDAAIAFAGLLARVVRALPEAAVPSTQSAVRCSHCNAQWFPTSGDSTCRRCRAPA